MVTVTLSRAGGDEVHEEVNSHEYIQFDKIECQVPQQENEPRMKKINLVLVKPAQFPTAVLKRETCSPHRIPDW